MVSVLLVPGLRFGKETDLPVIIQVQFLHLLLRELLSLFILEPRFLWSKKDSSVAQTVRGRDIWVCQGRREPLG
jgi:hypothetical protein